MARRGIEVRQFVKRCGGSQYRDFKSTLLPEDDGFGVSERGRSSKVTCFFFVISLTSPSTSAALANSWNREFMVRTRSCQEKGGWESIAECERFCGARICRIDYKIKISRDADRSHD